MLKKIAFESEIKPRTKKGKDHILNAKDKKRIIKLIDEFKGGVIFIIDKDTQDSVVILQEINSFELMGIASHFNEHVKKILEENS